MHTKLHLRARINHHRAPTIIQSIMRSVFRLDHANPSFSSFSGDLENDNRRLFFRLLQAYLHHSPRVDGIINFYLDSTREIPPSLPTLPPPSLSHPFWSPRVYNLLFLAPKGALKHTSPSNYFNYSYVLRRRCTIYSYHDAARFIARRRSAQALMIMTKPIFLRFQPTLSFWRPRRFLLGAITLL